MVIISKVQYFFNICLSGFGREFALAIFADVIKNPTSK
jgi:hypothetical protein